MSEFDTSEISNYSQLLEILKQNNISYDFALIKKAYEFAATAHQNQKRLSGDSFETHILTVTKYVALLKLDTISICAALLHDVVEKGNTTIDVIDKAFDTEIAYIVSGLSDIRTVSKNFNEEENSTLQKMDEFRNLIFKSSDDVRIIIIRLAEKLHNILTIDNVEKEKKIKAANKILNIYAPIASYLGLGSIKKVLEDSAFKIIDTKNFNLVNTMIEETYGKSESLIDSFLVDTKQIFEKYRLRYLEFYGRKKSVYSCYKKIKYKYSKGLDITENNFTDLKDVYAFRLIVKSLEECYLALGLLHANFQYSKDDFEDYISNPKENGYKSIHTVLEYKGTFLEIQIRTKEMHEFNEYGPASHIAYKLNLQSKQSGAFTWTKNLLTWRSKEKITKEDFKIKAFKDSIFVFTPKGLVIKLPEGSTPLDFAFRVHTNVGYCYQGAKVNNKMVNMDYKLKTGDTIEILTTKKYNVTSDWINHCFTNMAKSRIRKVMRSV